MSRTELFEEPTNPVDLVEQLASHNEWSFERSGDYEISLSIEGKYCDYHVSFQWMGEIEALHLACAFDFKVPDARHGEALKLVAIVNEQLWVGHFDLWRDEGMVMYRNALVLAGGATASPRQCEAMLKAALEAAERSYPAFNYLVWAGKTAAEAMDAVNFETEGNA